MGVRKNNHPFKYYGNVLYHGSEPHIQSRAALALLSAHLFSKDETVYSPRKWSEVRALFLAKILSEKGSIACHWCNKDNLKPHVPESEYDPDMATVDHIKSIARGGAVYDEANMVPSCFPCNARRNNEDQRPKHRHPKPKTFERRHDISRS